ncbi:MAG: O-antigen ligase family protein [Proteobacteria bacterium]|nr:O-antigen ligase family protein [Pseudomonadota bacterium]HQR04150.1 O-antigen ligase family protein [Rhodocyclaceae bacterium]
MVKQKTSGGMGGEIAPTLGVVAMTLYLMVLPMGHVAALRSVLLAVALVVAAWMWAGARTSLRPGLMAGMFAGWLAVALGSVLWAGRPVYTLDSALADVPRAALGFWAGMILARAGAGWRMAAVAGVLFFCVSAPMAIMAPRNGLIWQPGWLPAIGDYSTDSLVFFPVVVAALWCDWRNRSRLWQGFLMTGLIAGLVGSALSISRTFWLVLVLQLVLAAIFVLNRPDTPRRDRMRWLLVLAAVATACVAVAAWIAHSRGMPLTYFSDRAEIYPRVVDKLLHGPWLGHGYGKESDYLWYLQAFPDFHGIFHPHDLLLSFIDQLGVLGIPLLLALLGVPAWLFWRGYGRGAMEDRVVAVAGMAIMLGVVAKNSTDLFFYKSHLWLLYGVLGLLLGHLARDEARRKGIRPA